MTTTLPHPATADRLLESTFLAAARPFWHPVTRSCDVGPGAAVAVTLLDEELVVWRGLGGELSVLVDQCVHRGTRLSAGAVTDGCLRCPYHGWEFDRSGACARIPQLPKGPIPATARVASYQVAEHAGLVWVCLVPPGEERRGIPQLPESELAGTHVYAGEPIEWATQSTRQIENFCDIAHFSWLHLDVFGNPDVLEVAPHSVTRSDDGWQLLADIPYAGVNLQAPAGPDGRFPPMEIPFAYRVELPFAVHLGSTMADMPSVLFCATQPVSARHCRVFWVMAADESFAVPDEFLEAMEQAVFLADRAVIETQRPPYVPLDPGAELHLPFDRMAVAYRRALVELGFAGTTETAPT